MTSFSTAGLGASRLQPTPRRISKKMVRAASWAWALEDMSDRASDLGVDVDRIAAARVGSVGREAPAYEICRAKLECEILWKHVPAHAALELMPHEAPR